jgi:hypothetical protein
MAKNKAQALALLSQCWFDLAVAATPLPPASSLVCWLISSRPSLPLVLFAGRHVERLAAFAEKQQNVHVMPGDWSISSVLELGHRLGARSGFVTQAVEIELFDYLQLLAVNGADKVVEVRTPAGAAMFWFERGAMVHAAFGGLEGEDAFYAVIGTKTGTFRETLADAAPKHTITRSSTHLLMEAARLLDEGSLPSTALDEVLLGRAGEWARWDDDVDESVEETGSVRLAVVVDDTEKMEVKSRAPDDWSDLNDDELNFESDATPARNESIRDAVEFTHEEDFGPGFYTSEGPMLNSLIHEDEEVRRVLVAQFFEEPGVTGVAILDESGVPLISELGSFQASAERAAALIKNATRLGPVLGGRICESMVVRSSTQSHLVLASMGRAWVTLVVEPMTDPDEVRDRVMGIGP